MTNPPRNYSEARAREEKDRYLLEVWTEAINFLLRYTGNGIEPSSEIMTAQNCRVKAVPVEVINEVIKEIERRYTNELGKEIEEFDSLVTQQETNDDDKKQGEHSEKAKTGQVNPKQKITGPVSARPTLKMQSVG